MDPEMASLIFTVEPVTYIILYLVFLNHHSLLFDVWTRIRFDMTII